MTNLPVESDYIIPNRHRLCHLVPMHLHRPVFSFPQFPFVVTPVPYRIIPKRGVFPLALIGTFWKSRPYHSMTTKLRNKVIPRNESQACASHRLHEKTCSNMCGDILPPNCSRRKRKLGRHRNCASDRHEEAGSNQWEFNWEFSVVDDCSQASSLLWICRALSHGNKVWSKLWHMEEEWHELWKCSYSCLSERESVTHYDGIWLEIGKFTLSSRSHKWSHPLIIEMLWIFYDNNSTESVIWPLAEIDSINVQHHAKYPFCTALRLDDNFWYHYPARGWLRWRQVHILDWRIDEWRKHQVRREVWHFRGGSLFRCNGSCEVRQGQSGSFGTRQKRSGQWCFCVSFPMLMVVMLRCQGIRASQDLCKQGGRHGPPFRCLSQSVFQRAACGGGFGRCTRFKVVTLNGQDGLSDILSSLGTFQPHGADGMKFQAPPRGMGGACQANCQTMQLRRMMILCGVLLHDVAVLLWLFRIFGVGIRHRCNRTSTTLQIRSQQRIRIRGWMVYVDSMVRSDRHCLFQRTILYIQEIFRRIPMFLLGYLLFMLRSMILFGFKKVMRLGSGIKAHGLQFAFIRHVHF